MTLRRNPGNLEPAQRWSSVEDGQARTQGAALAAELDRLREEFGPQLPDVRGHDAGTPDRYGPAARRETPNVPASNGEGLPAAATRRLYAVFARCGGRLSRGVAFLAGRSSGVDTAGGDGLVARLGISFERELRNGLRVLLVGGTLALGWMIAVPLAAAVVVPGNLVVRSKVKTIQHPTGGVVAQIAVHEGMRVDPGELLVRLDATQARANLVMISNQLNEFRMRIARLVAERDGHAQVEMPEELRSRPDNEVKVRLAAERSLFDARATARHNQHDLLESRIAQLGEESTGIEAQLKSKSDQLGLIAKEVTGVQELYDKKLVPLTRLTALQRDAARIDGERGQLVSAGAETRAKISEARLQIVRVDQDFQTDVVKELGETQAKEAEFVERGVAARDVLDRIEIRAPTSGVVQQLAVHTIGGVIRPGEPIMEIVPDSDELLVEARLQPHDVDQVRPGQTAFVRFSAFNQRVTPQLEGLVSYVSADVSHDQHTSAPYFTVRVTIPEEQRQRLAGLQLVPGMPAEVFMQSGSRTMMSYLMKPITDQLQRAFVER